MTTLVNRPPLTRGGFTFVELVVVISVIVALSAIGFPVWGMISNRVKVNATESLVHSIATAITTYQTKTWTYNIEPDPNRPPIMRMYHMFDLNHNDANGNPQPDLYDNPKKTGSPRFFSIDGYMPSENDTNFYDTSKNEYIDVPKHPDPERENPPKPYDVNFHLGQLKSGYRGFIAMAQPQIKKTFINARGQVVDAWGRPLRIAFAAKVFGTQSFGVWSAGLDGKDSIKENDKYKDDETFPVIDDLRSWGGDRRGN